MVVKRMKSWRRGAGAGAAAGIASSALPEDSYQILSEQVGDRLTMAIVTPQGAAVAIEAADASAEIVQGLAAGAIVSDLTDAGEPAGSVPRTVPFTRDGRLPTRLVSRQETDAFIDELEFLSPAQRDRLRGALEIS